MQREAMLPNSLLEAVTLAERALTVVASAFNAGFFLSYTTGVRRRKIGSFALVLINLAFLVEGLYFLSSAFPGLHVGRAILNSAVPALVGVVPMAASLLTAVLILRQIFSRRKR